VQPSHLKELSSLFDLAMSDATSSWWLGPDGEWVRHSTDAEGKPLIDIQDRTMSSVQRRRRARAVR
jgi:polyphosphate kinase